MEFTTREGEGERDLAGGQGCSLSTPFTQVTARLRWHFLLHLPPLGELPSEG